MPEILVFSDSHGWQRGMQEAYARQIRRPHLLLHLGDGAKDFEDAFGGEVPTLGVCGNCDLFSSMHLPEERLTEEGGARILMTHGHRYGVKSGLGALIRRAVECDADIALFGHTHMPYLECIPAGSTICGVVRARPLYLFNPGSIGRSYGGASFGTISIGSGGILLAHGDLLS